MKILLAFFLSGALALLQGPAVRIPGPGGVGSAAGKSFVKATSIDIESSSTALTITLTGVTAHNQIFYAGTYTGAGATITCNDSASSNNWVTVTGSGNHSFACYTLNEAGSGTINVTATIDVAAAGDFIATEFSGATAFDAQSTLSSFSGTSLTWPSVTTTQAGDFIVAYAGSQSGNGVYTAGGCCTIPTNGQISGNNQNGMIQYQIAGGATAYTPTATVSPTVDGFFVAVAFK